MAKKSLAGRLLGGATTVAKFAGGVCLAPVVLLTRPFIKLEETVLVLGLPDAGKTVFFNVMLEKLQRLSNAYNGKDKFSVRYDDDETKKRVSDVIGGLRKREWPDAIAECETSKATIAFTGGNGKICEKECVFEDYDGEILAKAAELSQEKSNKPSAAQQTVNNLKKNIGYASGIMLVMDAAMLGEKLGNEADNDKIFSKIFQNAKSDARIALIFTKGDMLDEETKKNVENIFINRYPNTVSQFKSMQLKFKSFLVTAVECPDLRTPPKDFDSGKHSEGLIEPIKWLLDIKVPVVEDF